MSLDGSGAQTPQSFSPSPGCGGKFPSKNPVHESSTLSDYNILCMSLFGATSPSPSSSQTVSSNDDNIDPMGLTESDTASAPEIMACVVSGSEPSSDTDKLVIKIKRKAVSPTTKRTRKFDWKRQLQFVLHRHVW